MSTIRFEKTARTRMEMLQAIDQAVFDNFVEKNEQNLSIKDHDLRRWALQMNEKMESKLEGFKAGKKWLFNFKNRNGIVSRKVRNFSWSHSEY